MSLYGLGHPTQVHRIHHQTLGVAAGAFDWDLREGLAKWLRPEFATNEEIAITDSDGSFVARSIGEARIDVISRGSSVVEADLKYSKDGLAVAGRYRSSRTEVGARGVDENAVYGLMARLRQAVERGVIAGAASENLVTYDSAVTTGPAPSAPRT